MGRPKHQGQEEHHGMNHTPSSQVQIKECRRYGLGLALPQKIVNAGQRCPSGTILSAKKCLSSRLRTPLPDRSLVHFYLFATYPNIHRCKASRRHLFMKCTPHKRLPTRQGLYQYHKNQWVIRHKNHQLLCRNLSPNTCRQIFRQNYRIVLNRKIWQTIWRSLNRHKILHKNHRSLSPHRCQKSSPLSGEVLGEIAPFTKSLNC